MNRPQFYTVHQSVGMLKTVAVLSIRMDNSHPTQGEGAADFCSGSAS